MRKILKNRLIRFDCTNLGTGETLCLIDTTRERVLKRLRIQQYAKGLSKVQIYHIRETKPLHNLSDIRTHE